MLHAAGIMILILVIFLFAGLAFTFWVIWAVASTVRRILTILFRGDRPAPRTRPASNTAATCKNHLCRAKLPGDARFCRRCGVPQATSVTARRPASRMRVPA